MSVKMFCFSKPERDLEPGERWEAATEKTYPWGTNKTFAEAEADEPGWLVTHEGEVVGLREANFHDDSDFYAAYYDAETDSFKETCYASTRGWTYANGAAIDAPAEMLERYAAEGTVNARALMALSRYQEAVTPSKGKVVKVVKGRKIPVGTEAEVFWYGETQYGKRVGLILVETGEKVFTAARNVEVLSGMEVSA